MPTAPYYVDGERVPGTTTIIGRFKESGALIAWAWRMGTEGKDYRKVRDSAADAGTLCHAMCEADIRGKPIPECDDERAAQGFQAYLTWKSMTKLEILDAEMHLVSKKYRFGGTPDGIAEVNGEPCLLDFKTSNGVYSDHIIQLAAYCHLVNCNYEKKVSSAHLLRIGKEHADFHHHYFPASMLDDCWEAFKLMRELYDRLKKIKGYV